MYPSTSSEAFIISLMLEDYPKTRFYFLMSFRLASSNIIVVIVDLDKRRMSVEAAHLSLKLKAL